MINKELLIYNKRLDLLRSELITRGKRSKLQLSKPFRVVIQPLSTRLIVTLNKCERVEYVLCLPSY